MRKLAGTVFVSLDGVMQAPGGPEEDPTGGFDHGGWVAPLWSVDMGPFESIIMGEYDLLLGKRTYDIFASYWPYHQDNPVGAKFQRADKFVFTHSKESLHWENSSKLTGDTVQAVAELKRSDGPNLLIQGSSTLYPPLLSGRLIDRLTVLTFPIVLGTGKRIFGGRETPGALKLADHFVTDKGVVIATYEPAGDVETGSFADEDPSVSEIQRRARMKAGGA